MNNLMTSSTATTDTIDSMFAALVRAWDRREAARAAGDIGALADARSRLDEQRSISRTALR